MTVQLIFSSQFYQILPPIWSQSPSQNTYEIQLLLKLTRYLACFLTVTGTAEEKEEGDDDYSESSAEELEPEYIKTDTPDGFKIGFVHSCT